MSLIQFAKRYTSTRVFKEDQHPKHLICENNTIEEDFIICRNENLRDQLPKQIELDGEFLGNERQYMKPQILVDIQFTVPSASIQKVVSNLLETK